MLLHLSLQDMCWTSLLLLLLCLFLYRTCYCFFLYFPYALLSPFGTFSIFVPLLFILETFNYPAFFFCLLSPQFYPTPLLNISNLFWEVTFSFSSPSLFLQFQARYLNLLQPRQIFPFLPSSSTLNLARAYFSLSKLLIRELYCCKDIASYLYNGMELVLILASYNYICQGTKSSSNQIPTTLLTTVLVIWLYYHLKERIPTLNGLLEVTITPLHIPLIMEYCYTTREFSTEMQHRIHIIPLDFTIGTHFRDLLQAPDIIQTQDWVLLLGSSQAATCQNSIYLRRQD